MTRYETMDESGVGMRYATGAIIAVGGGEAAVRARLRAALDGVEAKASDGVLYVEGWACVYRRAHAAKSGAEVPVEMFYDASLVASPGGEVRALLMHRKEERIGSTADGSLELVDLPKGLAFRLRLPAGERGATIAEAVKSGRLRGASVGFTPFASEVITIAGEQCRVIRSAHLGEVSLVDNPAVPGTTIRVATKADRPLAEAVDGIELDVAGDAFITKMAELRARLAAL